MQNFNIVRKSKVLESFRVARVNGLFDMPRKAETEFTISGEIPDMSDDWKIGLIYGSSGSGKSTIANDVFGDLFYTPGWTSKPLVDDFSKELEMDSIIDALTSVGLSSAPVWLQPYSTLSNGQKFRADMARVLAEKEAVCVDEFTSVVDRAVAKSVCVALKKYMSRTGKRILLISCHADIIEWLQPDWVFNTNTGALSRDCLRRPQIKAAIIQGTTAEWPYFKRNHYMSADINPSAKVYLAYVFLDDMWHLVGFFSIIAAMGMKGWRRGHRTVVLPDYQGLGIGNRMIEATAQWLYDTQKLRFRARTSARSLIKHRLRNQSMWRCVQAPIMKAPSGTKGVKTSAGRLTSSWEYIPEQMRRQNGV